jgi:hypothetical protein
VNNINPDDLLPDELKKYIIDSSKEWFREYEKQHKVFQLSKGRKSRNIYIVNPFKKFKLVKLIPYLEDTLKKNDQTNVNYAFEKGKNCSLGAINHIGYKYTISFDLVNFFDSVRKSHVEGLLNNEVINYCFIDGAPRQGLPTSPLIATIAFLKCDQLIIDYIKKNKIDAVYTRYADDLIFSFNNIQDRGKITFLVDKATEANNFKINTNKTKFQNSRSGMRIITGLAVDNFGVHPTRKTKRKIRAAEHQYNLPSLGGLLEWAKCKLPN